ncbi:MAG: hypothetical protein KZQ70_00910 [gamma proteobacterium symbiont of Lucinoma myriamae]|nr:hypothetical protein [gamma proteobacterium symbiont of Lucinoma myriamae]MCU7817925.1 hypothetical protein [gamma proteobacterium symbiont of Lucinoma myriamae]
MKNLKTLLASTLIAATMITGAAQADNSLSSLIYEESSNIFAEVSYTKSSADSIRSYGDDANKDLVWSYEYEQYVNPADFKQAALASANDVNQYMSRQPTAAGERSDSVFIYNETAGEYHLQ